MAAVPGKPESSRGGSVFFDTGGYADGVTSGITSGLVRESTGIGVATEPELASPEVWQPGEVSSAGRLAANRSNGALASNGDRVVDVVGGGVVAGSPHTGATEVGSVEDGPAAEAAFSWILSIATDENGNLLVSEVADPAARTFRIRFVNRGLEPVRLFTQVDRETEVPPGGISTITESGPPVGSIDHLQSGWPAMSSAGSLMYVATTGADVSGAQRSTIQAMNLGPRPRSANGVELAPGMIRTIAGGPLGFEGDGGPAAGARFGRLPGISAAGDGILYVADYDNHRVRRIDAEGAVSTFVGIGASGPGGGGYNGNDRPAAEALLRRPLAVQATGDGRVWISDSENGQVRYVDPDGVIHGLPMVLGPTALCKEPTPGPRLTDIAADQSGAVYFTADGLSQVKRVDGTGAVTNVAGRPELTIRGGCQRWPPGCPTGDLRASTETALDRPTSLAAGLGGLYLFDAGHRAVRFVNTGAKRVRVHGLTVAPGQMRVVVAGHQNALARGVPGPTPDLSPDVLLAADRLGNLFVVDQRQDRGWVVDRRGTTTEVLSPTTDKEACCSQPISIAATPDGHLFILDKASNRIWFRNLAPIPVTVLGHEAGPGMTIPVVGNGKAGVTGEGVAALDASLFGPVAITVGTGGDLFLADAEDDTVSRVDAQGTVRAVAGLGRSYVSFNGDGNKALFTNLADPGALAVDACGRLLVADVANRRVRRVNLAPPCIPSGNLGGIAPAGRSRVILVVAGFASVGLTVAVAALVKRRLRRNLHRARNPFVEGRTADPRL